MGCGAGVEESESESESEASGRYLGENKLESPPVRGFLGTRIGGRSGRGVSWIRCADVRSGVVAKRVRKSREVSIVGVMRWMEMVV